VGTGAGTIPHSLPYRNDLSKAEGRKKKGGLWKRGGKKKKKREGVAAFAQA